MAERVRIRCPACGMHPFLENLEKTFNELPPEEVKLFLLKFGGKVPAEPAGPGYEKKGKGSAKGYMEMIEITDDYPEQLQKLEGMLQSRMIAYLQSRGYTVSQ